MREMKSKKNFRLFSEELSNSIKRFYNFYLGKSPPSFLIIPLGLIGGVTELWSYLVDHDETPLFVFLYTSKDLKEQEKFRDTEFLRAAIKNRGAGFTYFWNVFSLKENEEILLEIEGKNRKTSSIIDSLKDEINRFSDDFKEEFKTSLKRLSGHFSEDRLMIHEHEVRKQSTPNFYQQFRVKGEIHDIAKNIAFNTSSISEVKILMIDDNLKPIEKDIRRMKEYLGENVNIYWCKEYEKFLDFSISNARKRELKIYLFLQNGEMIKSMEELIQEVDYIFVDLLFKGRNLGHKIVRNLNKFRKFHTKCQFDIFILSRAQNTDNIQRCLNEGAAAYVFKDRILSIPYKIAELRLSEEEKLHVKKTLKYQNFRSLYKLPHKYVRKLQTERILPRKFFEIRENIDKATSEKERVRYENLINLYKSKARKWIRALPKADLHCHLGGSLDIEVIFNLSLNIVNDFIKKSNNEGREIASYLWKFLKEFVCDEHILAPWPDEKALYELRNKIAEPKIRNSESILKVIEILREIPTRDKQIPLMIKFKEFLIIHKSDWVKKKLGLENLNSNIVKLLAPEALVFPYLLREINTSLNSEKKLKDYQLRCFFLVFLGLYRERLSKDRILSVWREKNTPYSKALSIYSIDENNFITNLNTTIELINEVTGEHKNPSRLEILPKLISAKHESKNKSLPGYLRGCEYTGSIQLQNKLNIFIAGASVVMSAANENVRYLELRCSPSGFTKGGLLEKEAIETLLEGVDYGMLLSKEKGNLIMANIIITAKRHKAPDEIARHISMAIMYRNGLKRKDEGEGFLFPRIIGVDLAGQEAGYRPSRYVNDFTPLFRISFPITVHAGEADTVESIWEAVYKLHASRIGHGLTLHQNPFLMSMFRDQGIGIELNPTSNALTNPEFEKTDSYPLKKFVNEGIKVTINTDNRTISDTTLSDEFVKAAELWRDMSKWETLRIIKMGFVLSFLSKEEKRKLLTLIEEEIYEKIIKLEKIE